MAARTVSTAAALIALAAAPAAWAGDFHAAEATVLGMHRALPAVSEDFAVRRAPRLSLPAEGRLSIPTLSSEEWWTERDRLEVALSLLERAPEGSLLGGAAVAAKRIRRILNPSDNVHLKVRCNPFRDDYRAAIRVQF